MSARVLFMEQEFWRASCEGSRRKRNGGGGELCRVHGAEDLRGQAIFQTCEARP